MDEKYSEELAVFWEHAAVQNASAAKHAELRHVEIEFMQHAANCFAVAAALRARVAAPHA